MSCIIETLEGRPVADRRVEVVERKGLGHPDTICDSVAEAASVALSRLYMERTGLIAHYNVDKALLVAGQCAKRFGSGEVTRPMELIIGDRATAQVAGQSLPVVETVREAVDRWVRDHLPGVRPAEDLITRVTLAPGSEELRRVYAAGQDEVPSNDTSGASGYAPLSPTEELVLAVERYLNSAEFKRAFPDTGRDVKVMGVREDRRLALTVAMPPSCRHVASEAAYFARREEILHALVRHFASAPFEVSTSSADRGAGVASPHLGRGCSHPSGVRSPSSLSFRGPARRYVHCTGLGH
ncbi:MAG TPA: methionine adenosyltransferase [Methylomirabilota bacterium]|nr:methionine adenosyltransferase [Methylomirabilota bacterium]